MSGRSLAVAISIVALAVVCTGAGADTPKPITIGLLADCTSAFSGFDVPSVAAAELPLLERGARLVDPTNPRSGVTGATVAGRSIRLVFGCGDTQTQTALAEARWVVEALDAGVVIGPTTADEETALLEYMRRRPDRTFVDGAASAPVTEPPRNFFSFQPDARQWSAGLGSYAYHRLGWRRVVVLSTTDSFSWGQVAGFEAEFCSLGGTVSKRIWFPFTITDFAGVLQQIPSRGVDGFFVQSFTQIERSLVQNYPGLRGHSARRVLGGVWSKPGYGWWLNVRGQVIADPGGRAPAVAAFQGRLRRAFPRLKDVVFTDTVFAPAYYAAMVATLKALESVHGDLSHGQQRFRTALAQVSVDLPNGRVRLDTEHQAIVSNYLWRVNKPDGSDETLIRVVHGVDPTFDGYFTRHDQPPSDSTPACRKGHVPRWARSG